MSHDVSRRSFFGGVAAALGYLGLGPTTDLFAQNRPGAVGNAPRMAPAMNEYDTIAHLSSNENCWGPPESVMKAMNNAWKYSNRYGYPDANIVGEIAKHHGVKHENVLLTAGSGEVLDVVGTTFLPAARKCSASSRRTARSISTPPASRPPRSSYRSTRTTRKTSRR
jgi:Histidinol-phosphate/aromatic aminotransferase and cobyric acid decarboxylase